jgi:hypothetical protein
MDTVPHLPTLWVSAAPFRYHVQHLMAATGVPWQVIAAVADLPQQQVRTLLFGRDGHRRPRLSPYAARRLLALDMSRARELQARDLPADFVADSAGALVAAGVTLTEIATWLDLDLYSTRRLLSGVGECSHSMDIMLRLACVQRGLLVEPEAREVA